MKNRYRTFIVDDEPLAVKRLNKLLLNFSDTIEVIGTAGNGTVAKEQINLLQPDLVFLDIEMPGLTGFQLLELLNKVPLIVFCTAYDEYSLKAFETNSIDYLIKPVRVDRLEKTITKLEQFNKSLYTEELLSMIKKMSDVREKPVKTTITVKSEGKLKFIKLENVVSFKAKDKYVDLVTDEGCFLIEKSLTELETGLPDFFVRIHRAVIININFIKEAQKYFNNRYVITLKNRNQDNIITGRSYNLKVKELLGV